MRFLFFKPDLAWPRTSGHDVHTYNMMRALSRLGMTVGLVTSSPVRDDAIAGIDLALRQVVPVRALQHDRRLDSPLSLSWLEERFRSYWGTSTEAIARFGSIALQFAADVVVVSGLDVLPMLGAVENAQRVWYAADEWFWHHLSLVRIGPGCTEHLRAAVIKGVYERAYRRRIDRAWVVSEADARAMRFVAAVQHVDVIPNGVDSELYASIDEDDEPETAVFWGRLDFDPNVQGLEWFCRKVWPEVRRVRPRAKFQILGFHPIPAVTALARVPGVAVQPDVDDIRPIVRRHAVVVLPFRSGGGIKNKLLEAAAMGKPIVCSPRAANGLEGTPPLTFARSATEWADALCRLWEDRSRRAAAGAETRLWVTRHHTWEASARRALAGVRRAS
jgi:glycosyltransferase involved in cell wall biosynthesis